MCISRNLRADELLIFMKKDDSDKQWLLRFRSRLQSTSGLSSFFFFLFRRNVDLAERERADFSQCVRDDLRVFSFHAPPMPGFSPCFIIVAVIDFFFLLLFFFFYFTLVLRLPWDCTRSRPDTLTGSRWRLPCRSWNPFAKERYDRRRPRCTASISRVLTQRSTIRFQTLSNL